MKRVAKKTYPPASMEAVDEYLTRMEATQQIASFSPADLTLPLKVGVDLGTSNIVITVLDNRNQPVAFASRPAHVVRDGIVVGFMEAVNILAELKEALEKRLGLTLAEAATAIPPNILPGNVKVIANVVAAVGFRVVKVIDEPEAAALMMQIADGAVVDIGGGTTGISLLRDGKVVYSVDEPTGGTHMTLVVAGNTGLEFDQAEDYKVLPENYARVFTMVHPVIEKMAQITKSNLREKVGALYLAGGASCFKGIQDVFEAYTGIKTYKPENPLLVTPIGIALSIPSVEV